MKCTATLPTTVSNAVSFATRATSKRCTDVIWRASIPKTRFAKFLFASSTAAPSKCSTPISRSTVGTSEAFPWRHSPNPLPRLCLPDSSGIYEPIGPRGFAGIRSDTASRFIFHVSAARLMNVPWMEVLLAPKKWETPLANNCAAAFRTCLGCLFSNIFRVPLQSIILKDEAKLNSDPLVSYDSDAFHYNRSNIHRQADGNITVEDERLDVIDDAILLPMLDSKLLDLYRQQKSLSAQPSLSVLLQTQIVSAKLENLHSVPFLTREIVQHNPNLRGSINEIITNAVFKNQIQQQPILDTMYSAAEEFEALSQKIFRSSSDSLADDSSFSHADIISWTVVAQVTILCKEKFRIIDVRTGECVQGDRNAKERLVPHLVRFERVTRYNHGTGTYFIGQWKITDWDDLLDGNIWY